MQKEEVFERCCCRPRPTRGFSVTRDAQQRFRPFRIHREHSELAHELGGVLLCCLQLPYLPVEGGNGIIHGGGVHERPRPHHQHDVGDRRDVRDDVGGEEHDLVMGQARQKAAEPHALLGIKASCGLVEHEHRGVCELGLRDTEASLHAAGEAPDAPVGGVCQVDEVEHLLDTMLRRRVSQPLHRCHVAQELPRREIGVAIKVLRKVAEARVVAFAEVLYGDAVEADGASRRVENPAYHSHEGCLARAVGAEQPVDARREAHIDVVHDRPVPERLGNAGKSEFHGNSFVSSVYAMDQVWSMRLKSTFRRA